MWRNIFVIAQTFAIWWLEYSFVPAFLRSFDATEVRRLLVKLVAFAVVALALSLWKHRLRIHWGWIAIAMIGLVLTSAIDEMISRNCHCRGTSFHACVFPFPFEIVAGPVNHGRCSLSLAINSCEYSEAC